MNYNNKKKQMCDEMLCKPEHYSWQSCERGRLKYCWRTIRKVLHEDACTRNRQPPASYVSGCKDTNVDKLAEKNNNNNHRVHIKKMHTVSRMRRHILLLIWYSLWKTIEIHVYY